jgi:hypothetical protein
MAAFSTPEKIIWTNPTRMTLPNGQNIEWQLTPSARGGLGSIDMRYTNGQQEGRIYFGPMPIQEGYIVPSDALYVLRDAGVRHIIITETKTLFGERGSQSFLQDVSSFADDIERFLTSTH